MRGRKVVFFKFLILGFGLATSANTTFSSSTLQATFNFKGDDNFKDLAATQLDTYKIWHGIPPYFRTDAGRPVTFIDANNTASSSILENVFLLDELSHFTRERIPERVTNARGAGAFGSFFVTNDVSKYTKANFLSFWRTTKVAVRFSTWIGERGSPDTAPDARGFAIKFYTDEGNMDFVGWNFPIFFIDEPLRLPSLVHAFKNNPVTNLKDNNMMWDFATLERSVFNALILLFSDYGTPYSYRHIDGYPVHTYELENNKGEICYARFVFKSDQGLKNLLPDVAAKIAGSNPGYATQDLYNAIQNWKFPKWKLYMQVMTPDQVQAAGFNPFSVLRTWPNDTYKLQQIGELKLDKNPADYFAQVEQAAFSPGNLVPGILGSPDRLFRARLFSYRDSQYHRLGTNYLDLPINKPSQVSKNYNSDGVNGKVSDGAPNYYPNSFNGPKPFAGLTKSKHSMIGSLKDRYLNELDDGDVFAEARNIYENFLKSEAERRRLARNIAESLVKTQENIQKRALAIFEEINNNLAQNIKKFISDLK